MKIVFNELLKRIHALYHTGLDNISTLNINAYKEHKYFLYVLPIVTFILVYNFIYLTNFYLPLPKQFVLGWGLICVLLICNKIDKFKKPPLRIFFVLISVFINVRYLYWRTTETLVCEGPLDTMGTVLLYGAELYALSLHFMGIFANIWPQETKIMPLPEDTSLYPSVDILIPTYNESVEIVKITTIAALHIDYPKDKLHIHILDDGATVAKRNNPDTSPDAWARHYDLRRMAKELGVNYITRERNLKAKAGNLNHALNHTCSDLVLVLDCDHVPAKDILKNTAGWFLKDEKLALVQTPHFFINPNPIEKNIDALKDAPSEHEMFYRANHPGMDFWNSSFFCGSAAILRRTYLEVVGGISGETITEDCETAFSLHRKGYNSVYISRPMVCGLSPETFDDFIVQRSRWAQGMTQLMILNNPLFAKGLKLYQRLCYFNNAFFWFFGISRFIFFLAPAAFLLLGLHVYFASVNQVLAYAVPHIISSIILTDFFYGKFRWPFLSELFESIQSLFLMPVVMSVVLNPRKPSFKVTPKGKSLENEFLSGLTLPFYLMCLLLFISIPAAIVKWYTFPLYRDVVLVTIIWTLFNFSLAMAAFGAFFERRQIRRHHRMWAKGKLLVHFPRLNMTVEGSTQDISLSGIGISFSLPFELKPQEHVQIESRDSHGEKYFLEARIQRAVQKGEVYTCGTEFIIRNEEQFATSVRFVYSDSQRWVDYWSRHTHKANPFRVLLYISKMALKGFMISIHTSYIFFVLPIVTFARNRAARIVPLGVVAVEKE
jgi:cellulose synthase (UDP-forming)